jgi:hypothetical protein
VSFLSDAEATIASLEAELKAARDLRRDILRRAEKGLEEGAGFLGGFYSIRALRDIVAMLDEREKK